MFLLTKLLEAFDIKEATDWDEDDDAVVISESDAEQDDDEEVSMRELDSFLMCMFELGFSFRGEHGTSLGKWVDEVNEPIEDE